MSGETITKIRFRLDGVERTAKGRDGWCLGELLKAGAAGCTPIHNPAPRWSGYILKLRKLGLVIETIHEVHGGNFSGRHARYVLRSCIEILEIVTTSPNHAVAA